MPRLALVGPLCTALLAALPAAGGTILYATAASQSRVDGFCVGGGGGLAPAASVHLDTKGTEPRRFLAAPGPAGVDGVLYVGERDRVEAFKIGPHGGLSRLGQTGLITNPPMDVMDMALSPDGRTLYVAQNGPDRIAAYPLDAAGAVKDFTSCIQGRPSAAYRALLVSNSLLYVSEQLTPGRIGIFPIDAGGGLGHDPSACTTPRGAQRPEATMPMSEQRRIQRPRSFFILHDRLYVEDVGTRRIKAFRLQPDGLFPPPTMVGKRLRWEKPVSRTASVLVYADVVLFRSTLTLLASQFERGRIDAYRLKPDGRLPRQPTRHTKEDVRTSPVRMTTVSRCSDGSNDGLACASAMDCPGGKCSSVLYVAAGELDRVQAFRLRQSDGLPASPTPFSQTDEQTGSFPNDVALAMLSEGCR